MKPLVIDVGGTHVKLGARCCEQTVEFDSGPELTPQKLVKQVKKQTKGWDFDRIALGIPALVKSGRVTAEPGNLSRGWVGYNFARAFRKPVRIINDAALQALGSYDGGRMLFLGFGTGVGSVLVSQWVIVPLELGDLVIRKKLLSERLGREGRHRIGKKRWRKEVLEVSEMLQKAFAADYVVLGGGKAGEGQLDPLPRGFRGGGNHDAITGGYRLWEQTVEPHDRKPSDAWRVLH